MKQPVINKLLSKIFLPLLVTRSQTSLKRRLQVSKSFLEIFDYFVLILIKVLKPTCWYRKTFRRIFNRVLPTVLAARSDLCCVWVVRSDPVNSRPPSNLGKLCSLQNISCWKLLEDVHFLYDLVILISTIPSFNYWHIFVGSRST